MRLVGFYVDIHIGAPNEFDFSSHLPTKFDKNTYFIGDIYDLANCKKSKVISLNSSLRYMKKIWGDHWIDGNHERQGNSDTHIFITDTTIAMHGDFISWGKERSDKYRSKPQGASFLKRSLWVNAVEIAELGIERDLDDADLERADQYIKELNEKGHKVNTIIIGHMHPRFRKDFVTKNLNKVIVLPRGYTLIDVHSL